jgi:uncharacterized protein YwgA/O-acetyl-ADP-ribose deacetylase (regulator of RNase III)
MYFLDKNMSTPQITVRTGDLLQSEAQTLVNTVNCVGVMGKGIALAFRQHFPDMYQDYVQRCNDGEVQLGKPYLYKRVTFPWILNFPTKDHWRSVSKLSDIVSGLEYLKDHYKKWEIKSLAVPPLGCGNGQLEWNVVGPTIYRSLKNLDIPIEIFAPYDTPASQMTSEYLQGQQTRTVGDSNVPSKVNPAFIALVGVLSRIYNEKYHWPVGRIALQKIAYFLTEIGVPTGLKYRRGSFGPFSSELSHAIATLQNHQLVIERQVGQGFHVAPGPTYRDARTAYMQDLKKWSPEIERVADLFLRLSRSSDIEIAATIHFAAKELAERNEDITELQVFEEVLEWKKKRRPPLNRESVAENVRALNMLGWIHATVSNELPVEEEIFA